MLSKGLPIVMDSSVQYSAHGGGGRRGDYIEKGRYLGTGLH